MLRDLRRWHRLPAGLWAQSTLLGVAVVLMACRYYWMQLFLGIAIIAGAVIAVLLRWLQRRNSHISIA